jgi:hypothetical protein
MQDIYEFDEDGDVTRYDAEAESFRITSDDTATWAMRKALAAQQRIDANRRVAEKERHRIESWLESSNAKPERDLAYFTGLLTEYASDQRAEGRKTIDTPYGVVKSRQGQPSISIQDPAEFIAWAQDGHEELLTVKVTPSLSAVKALAEIEATDSLGLVAITPDGEVIPGIEITPASVTYKVEVSK